MRPRRAAVRFPSRSKGPLHKQSVSRVKPADTTADSHADGYLKSLPETRPHLATTCGSGHRRRSSRWTLLATPWRCPSLSFAIVHSADCHGPPRWDLRRWARGELCTSRTGRPTKQQAHPVDARTHPRCSVRCGESYGGRSSTSRVDATWLQHRRSRGYTHRIGVAVRR